MNLGHEVRNDNESGVISCQDLGRRAAQVLGSIFLSGLLVYIIFPWTKTIDHAHNNTFYELMRYYY